MVNKDKKGKYRNKEVTSMFPTGGGDTIRPEKI